MSILERFSLRGQHALVTGCSRGIGRAVAVGLAEAGADIIGVASRDLTGSSVATEVQATGRTFTAQTCDLSDPQNVTRLMESLAETRIDILVNNAGIIRRSPAHEHCLDDWRAVQAVNLEAPWRIAQHCGRGMLARGSGRIVFLASLLSFQGGMTVPGYAASKGAIAQLTKALANEWTAHGVTVNAIAPGYIATAATDALRADPQRGPAIQARIPAGRWGTPDDLIGAAVYLASPAAAYVSGHVLTVDGGWMAR